MMLYNKKIRIPQALPTENITNWVELKRGPTSTPKAPKAVVEKTNEYVRDGMPFKDAAMKASMEHLIENRPPALSPSQIRTVPEVKRKVKSKLSPNQQLRMEEAHANGLSLAKAAEYADVSKQTLLRHWREKGMKSNYPRPLPAVQARKLKQSESVAIKAAKSKV
jgi:hypothetical protein